MHGIPFLLSLNFINAKKYLPVLFFRHVHPMNLKIAVLVGLNLTNKNEQDAQTLDPIGYFFTMTAI